MHVGYVENKSILSKMAKNKELKYLLLLSVFLMTSVFVGYGQEKVKGLSFVASRDPIGQKDVDPIVEMNANWVTLMPYGYIGKDGLVKFNTKWQWWGEKERGVKETIELCQKAGLKIMLKPQIWMMNAYTGDFKLNSEKEWVEFESSYEDFILFFLKIAAEYDLELFCIGTEWREFVAARPEFWNGLISKARQSFKGELTYAANWDDYSAVPFWREMDYIGVNGYFPISYSKSPGLKELVAGWEIHRGNLKGFSEENDRQIIFTEIGYRSMEGATVNPWEHNNRDKFSEEIQDLAYKALFSVLWKEDWFKGLFIWKWYHNHDNQGGKGNLDFTPQNKMAEKTIRTQWSKG